MKKNKYPIHSDFKKLEKLATPYHKPALYFLQGIAKPLYKKEKGSAQIQVRRLTIPVGKDKKGKLQSIRALLYAPVEAKGKTPCLIFYHGGGFVLPASPHHYRLARQYALGAKCKVLFVEYRLAPKYVFPTPVDDCYLAYQWLKQNAQSLSVDEKRIAVCGDSAGGTLATIVALRAKEKGEKICGQMLIYPATALNADTPSKRKYADTPMCNSRLVEKYTALFLGGTKKPRQRKYVVPLEARDVSGMPKTYLETAEFDCLRDEGILYGEKLKKAGVEVERYDTVGTIHAFDIVEKSEIVNECVRKRTAFLKKVFKN